jgi:hypothetical protein
VSLKQLSTMILLVAMMASAQKQKESSLKLDHNDLTVLGITIGSTTKRSVIQNLGDTPTFKTRHNDDTICYRAEADQDNTVVAFYFGALGGWMNVTEISISTSGAFPWHFAHCRRSPWVSKDLRFLRGLTLGSGMTAVIDALGPPSHSKNNRLSYFTSHDCPRDLVSSEDAAGKKGSLQPSCEVVDSVEATFTQNEGLNFITFYHYIDQ